MATNVTIGSSNLNQNHPRIISVVSNTEEVYQSNDNNLKIFAAIISEKGTEEFKTVSHPSEFLDEYGALDSKKYGQEGYNVRKWLQSGGQALVKRIMPDDATYAHAFINIRSKNVGADVHIQPLISSVGGAHNEDILDFTLEESRTVPNYDGFKDNVICELIPVGRGKAYNNIGFRIYSNKQYDNFLSCRIYNIEIIKFSDNGLEEIAEGPFAVSFYRDALSPINDESIFIEDVLNKYSKMVRAKVNDEAFLAVCRQICPLASNPYVVDPLFGETRIINGSHELVAGKDVHYNLFQKSDENIAKDSMGNVILNIADYNNAYSVSSIELEDEINRLEYIYNDEDKLNDMAAFVKIIRTESEPTLGTGDYPNSILNGDSLNQNADALIRGMISRSVVAGNEANLEGSSNLKTLYNRYLINELNYKMALNKKESGSADFDKFITLYSSELKLVINNSLDNRIAFILNKVSDLYSIIGNLGLTTDIFKNNDQSSPVIQSINAAVADLEDEYNSASEKDGLADQLLDTNFSTGTSLGFMFNKVIESCKVELNGSVTTAGEGRVAASALQTAYQAAYDVRVSNTYEQAVVVYEQEKNKLVSNRPLYYQLINLKNPVRFRDGSDGCFDMENPSRNANIEKYLVNFFNGNLDPLITSTKLIKFNFILDGNYSENVKNAIVNLATNIRRDFIFIADCGLNATAEGDLAFRSRFNVSSNYVAIYGQNVVVYDEASGRDVKVTVPYLMAGKIPELDDSIGLHYPIAGSRRGLVSGFKSISYLPNDIQQEDLYNARVNYIIGDSSKNMLGSQLTSEFKRTPLSDLNNVITMLNIKREAENIVESYQFEFNDGDVMNSMKQALKFQLSGYVSSGCIDSVDCSVYASEYDLLQHIVRVNIIIRFRDIIETVIITLEVTR